MKTRLSPLRRRRQSALAVTASRGFTGGRLRLRRLRRTVGRRSQLRRFSAAPLLIPESGRGRGRYEPGAGSLRSLRAYSRLAIAAVIALTVLAIAMAIAGGSHGSASQAGPPKAEPALVRAGLQLAPLQGWKPSAVVPRLPGLSFIDPISLHDPASGMRLVVGLLPASSPTMVPPGLLPRLQASLGRPNVVQLEHGFEADYYPRLSVDGLAAPLDLYVFPTTAGIVTAACVAASDGGVPYYDCWKNVATLQLLEGRALRLGPDAAFRQRLLGVIAALETTRQSARRDLARRIPVTQARAASRVAVAYEQAAASLLPVTQPSSNWARGIVAQLNAVGEAYRGVVSPLRRAETATYARTRAIVHQRERRLERLIRDPE